MSDDEDHVPTPAEFQALVRDLCDCLKDKGPNAQGAALADVVAMFFAGHHPAMREEMITLWTATMRKLIPLNEAAMFETRGRPKGWETQ